MKTTWVEETRRWVPLTPEIQTQRLNGESVRSEPRVEKSSPQTRRRVEVENIIKARRKVLETEHAKGWPEGTDLPFRVDLIDELLAVTKLRKTDPKLKIIIRSLQWIIALNRMMKTSDLSASAVAKRLRSIEVAARTFQLSGKQLDDLPAQVQHALWAMASDAGESDPDDRMHRIVDEGEDGTEDIRRWASKGAALTRSDAEIAGTTKARQIVDEVISGILTIWIKTLGYKISWSRTNDVASGPLIRFVMACLYIVKEEIGLVFKLEPNAVGQRIQRLIDDAGHRRARSAQS